VARTVRGAKVLITGATSGIGSQLARRAVRERARAVVVWDADRAALGTLVNELGDDAFAGTSIHGYPLDLRELGAIAQNAQKVRKQVGNPDVLVNVAGGSVDDRAFWEQDSGDDVRGIVQASALAPMYITREFLPGMIANVYRAYRIMNVAWLPGLLSPRGGGVDAASSRALVAWSRSLRHDLARHDHSNVAVTTFTARRSAGSESTGLRSIERQAARAWRAMLAGSR
jgi:NAD(P)-dependent dehydrogenase (short-subunit alcohol dehydrogenase family)